jgi:hypothetical protein
MGDSPEICAQVVSAGDEMMFDVKKLIAGAVSGFVGAAVVDIHAWSKSEGKFDWVLAFKRWIAGAVSGVTAAMGIGSL